MKYISSLIFGLSIVIFAHRVHIEAYDSLFWILIAMFYSLKSALE